MRHLKKSMIFSLTLLSLISLFSCKTNEEKVENPDFQDFAAIQIEFVTGDEVMTLHQMSIFKDGESLKAIKEKPNYYYGTKTDSVWTTNIGKPELKLINEFISIAETHKDTCSFLSTSIDRYKINIGNKTQLNITGNCDWNGIDYDSLEKKIFEYNFSELEIKREFVADSIIRSLSGIWDVYSMKNEKVKNNEVVLIRTNDSAPKIEGHSRWTIDKTQLMNIRKNLDIDEGSSLIELRGSTYDIINIEINRIELKYLW